MATYRVLVQIKPRKSPSMYETATLDNLPVGYTFDSSVTQALIPNPPIAGQVGAITWVKLPNDYWVPLIYKTIEFVKDVTPPPTTGNKKFTLSLEGFVPYNGELTPLS